MGAITVRLTDESRDAAYPSAEAYIQSLLIEEQALRSTE